MNVKTNISLFFGLLATLVLASPANAQGNGNDKGGGGGPNSTEYTVVDLDNRPGLVRSGIADLIKIGDNWYCVGYLDDDTNGNRAVMWEVSPSGSNYTVRTHYLTDGESAVGINELGESVGRSGLTYEPIEDVWVGSGLYWSSHTANPLVLPPLAGDNETDAFGINVEGVIVGKSTRRYIVGANIADADTAVAWRAFMGEIRGPFVLGAQPGTSSEREAQAVNDCDEAGVAQAVGTSELGVVHWELQCLEDYPYLEVNSGPDPLVPTGVGPLGINNLGDSCGTSHLQAFRMLADGTFETLSTPRNAVTVARDINDNRQVVGQVWDRQRQKGTYGVLWQADGSRVDLNKFLGRNSPWHRIWWGLTIDSEGTIGGRGSLDSGGNDSRALLMIAN